MNVVLNRSQLLHLVLNQRSCYSAAQHRWKTWLLDVLCIYIPHLIGNLTEKSTLTKQNLGRFYNLTLPPFLNGDYTAKLHTHI